MTDSKDEQSRSTLTDTEKKPVATSGRVGAGSIKAGERGYKQKYTGYKAGSRTSCTTQGMWQCFVITINGK